MYIKNEGDNLFSNHQRDCMHSYLKVSMYHPPFYGGNENEID